MRVVLIFIVILFYSCIRIDLGKNETRKDNYKGVITKIYQDKIQHYTWTLQIKTNTDIIDRDAQLWPKCWEYATVGDSIIKPADTLMVIITKNVNTSKKFFYKF